MTPTLRPTITPAPTVTSTLRPTITPAPTVTPTLRPTITPTPTPFIDYDLAFGKSEFNRQCALCHGSTGTGGPGGSLKINTCSTCTNLNVLTAYIAANMPSPGACIGKCSTSIAAYIFNNFNVATAIPIPTAQPSSSPTLTPTQNSTAAPTAAPVVIPTIAPSSSTYKLSDISELSAEATLRKATIILFNRLPTAEERDPIIANGDAGLEDALNVLVESVDFSARIGEIYKEEIKWVLPTGVDENYIVIENLGKAWWSNTTDGNRNRSNAAIRNSGKALVEYTVKNNLPISNILTADYMMVNPFSARTLNVYEKLGFSGIDNENDWRKVTLTEKWTKVDSTCRTDCTYHWAPFNKVGTSDGSFGHVGLLTDVFWLDANPYTNTNLNRARARMVYKNFLDFDVMTLGGERSISDDAPVVNNPTINNPNCSICHSYVDPIAATFLQRQNRSTYNPAARLTNPNLFPAGFKKSLSSIELYGDVEIEKTENPLHWLANQLVNDPRFTMAQIHIIYRGLMGKDILRNNANSEALAAQNQVFNIINTKFKSNNQNIKIIVKELIKTKYFRAEGITDSSNFEAHANTGTVRLLSIPALNKKLKSLLGTEWVNFYTTRYENKLLPLAELYSNPDTSENGEVTVATASNVAIQRKLALDMSCNIVPREFFFENIDDRLLMKKVSKTQVPTNSDGSKNIEGESAIIANIQHLHMHLFGEKLNASHPEIQKIYKLWVDTWTSGNNLIKQDTTLTALPCTVTYHPTTQVALSTNQRLLTDPNYVIRSWIMVMTYLLSDYRIYYE